MSQDTVTDGVDVVDSGTEAGPSAGVEAGTEDETSLGLDENVASAVAYLFGIFGGIAIFLLERENRTVRFHAVQSTILSGGLVGSMIALGLLGAMDNVILGDFPGFLVGLVVSLGTFGVAVAGMVVWVYLLIRTFQGANPRLPAIAGTADGLVD